MEIDFSARQSLSQACEMTKSNWYILACVVLINMLASFIPGGALISMLVSVGLAKMSLDVVDGKQPTFDAFKLPLSTYCNFIIGSIVLSVIVIVGCLLLIVPGIYLAMRLVFTTTLIVDKDMQFIDAMKASWAMTEDNVWHLFLADVLISLFAMVGVLCFGIGVLYTLPVASVAMMLVYRSFVSNDATEVIS